MSLQTRRARPGESPSLRAEGEGGSSDWQRFLGATSGSHGRFDWNAGLQRLTTDNAQPNSRFQQTSAAFSAGARIDPRTEARAVVRFDEGTTGTPGPTAFGPPDLDASFELAVLRRVADVVLLGPDDRGEAAPERLDDRRGVVDRERGLRHVGEPARVADREALDVVDAFDEVDSLVALARIADETALPACRDAANRPGEPDYVLGAALRAVEQIEAATKARQSFGPAACSRCGKPTTAEERALAESQFQRVYCGACFNAVFIERRNFDMKVQSQKTILAADRTVVQSRGERQIADWLHAHGSEYRYDDKFQIIQGFVVRPDFYLQRYDLYIEYWGLDTTDYKIGMLHKQKFYQQQGKRLLSIYPSDLPHLDAKLTAALRPHLPDDETSGASRVAGPGSIALSWGGIAGRGAQMDATHRFSGRVEHYVKYRPRYPVAVIEILRAACGLDREWVVADVGSGTGSLSELFLRNGNRVFGVEPNREMREAGEKLLAACPQFVSVDGRAEATTAQTMDPLSQTQRGHHDT